VGLIYPTFAAVAIVREAASVQPKEVWISAVVAAILSVVWGVRKVRRTLRRAADLLDVAVRT
jgi:hypothetical protein